MGEKRTDKLMPAKDVEEILARLDRADREHAEELKINWQPEENHDTR